MPPTPAQAPRPRRDAPLEAVVVRERPSVKKPIPAVLRELIEDGIVG